MRDRLKELIKDTLQDWECDVSDETIEQISDHLIDNGVIAPPVKVGQTVYRVNYQIGNYCEYTVKALYFTEDKKYYPKPHILVQHEFSRGRLRFNFAEIGKTVFLTPEEAEKALAERSKR